MAHQRVEVVEPTVGRDVLAELHAALEQGARLGFQDLVVGVEQRSRREKFRLVRGGDGGRGGGDRHAQRTRAAAEGVARRAEVAEAVGAAGGAYDLGRGCEE